MKKRLDETDEELLSLAITEFRDRFNSESKEIIVPFEIDLPDKGIKFTIPKLGEKKKLLELSEKNVLFFKREKLNQYEKLNPEFRTERLLNLMMKDLRLNQLPIHIECFDNSNFQGDFPVSAIVVFRDAKPSKKDYRHFNVKTVVGPDDFATMEEAVFRRYSRLLEEGETLPQLIVIDGGKGQLSSVYGVLEALDLHKKVPVASLAKKNEEIYLPNQSDPIILQRDSQALRLCQAVRDETHRFATSHNKLLRSGQIAISQLENINGIGSKKARTLMTTYGSLVSISQQNIQSIARLIQVSNTKAQEIIEYLLQILPQSKEI
jgi:excinuclease ABC subunit C